MNSEALSMGVELERVVWEMDLARRRRDQAIHDAHRYGLPVIRIAEAANMSRQNVYRILKEEK